MLTESLHVKKEFVILDAEKIFAKCISSVKNVEFILPRGRQNLFEFSLRRFGFWHIRLFWETWSYWKKIPCVQEESCEHFWMWLGADTHSLGAACLIGEDCLTELGLPAGHPNHLMPHPPSGFDRALSLALPRSPYRLTYIHYWLNEDNQCGPLDYFFSKQVKTSFSTWLICTLIIFLAISGMSVPLVERKRTTALPQHLNL